VIDYVPGRPAPPAKPDTTLARAVFPWLVARLAARRREDMPVTEASLRADAALGFAAQAGDGNVWPEAQYDGAGSARLGLLVRQPEPAVPLALECRYARRADAGQQNAARQYGDLLRDALRLHRSFGERGLPLLLLLCTDEFRTYFAAQRPPLRPLRPDSVDQELRAELRLSGLEDATLNRLGELDTEGAQTLHLTLDVLGYAPVGPLHLGLWRVAEARLA
jgi:hypothetical protein